MLLIACFSMQCSSAQNQDGNQKGMTATFMTNKAIDAKSDNGNHYVRVNEGEHTVFEITSISGGDPRNDTQIKTSFMFQISSDLSSFETAAISNAFLQRHCRCMDAGYNILSTGEVQGTKNSDGTWNISAAIKAEGNDSGDLYPFEYTGVAKPN